MLKVFKVQQKSDFLITVYNVPPINRHFLVFRVVMCVVLFDDIAVWRSYGKLLSL